MSQVESLFDYPLPSDPNQRQNFKNQMDEVVKAMTIIQSQNDIIKESLTEMKEEFGIPNEFLRNIANSQVKENFNKGRQKTEAKLELVDAYNTIIAKKNS